MEQLRAELEAVNQEKSEVLNLLEKRSAELDKVQIFAQQLQLEYQQLQQQFHSSQQIQMEEERKLSAGVHQNAQQRWEATGGRVDLAMGGGSMTVDEEVRAQMERLTLALEQENIELQKVMRENEGLRLRLVF